MKMAKSHEEPIDRTCPLCGGNARYDFEIGPPERRHTFHCDGCVPGGRFSFNELAWRQFKVLKKRGREVDVVAARALIHTNWDLRESDVSRLFRP